jgi:hypothetical protein
MQNPPESNAGKDGNGRGTHLGPKQRLRTRTAGPDDPKSGPCPEYAAENMKPDQNDDDNLHDIAPSSAADPQLERGILRGILYDRAN